MPYKNKEDRLVAWRKWYYKHPGRWYEIHKKWKNNTKEQRIKRRARMLVNLALRQEKIKKLPCKCGNEKTEAHHDDYNKPMDVIWLCKRCHELI